MVNTSAVVALVVGVLLAVIGGLGTVGVLVGALAGILEWGLSGWLLLLALVGGTGLATYGAVSLAGDLVGTVSDEGISGLTNDLNTHELKRYLE